MSLAFIDSEKDFILIKLKLKNFERISEIIKLNASIRSFVEKTHIFIGHNISKDSIIYYNLDLYSRYNEDERGICLFNSYAYLAEGIANFHAWYWPHQVATTQNKVNSYVRYFK